jgi:hypothetical protein
MNATGDEVRRLVVAALEEANVTSIRADPRIAKYAGGGIDVPLADIEMDSLALMEFCIAIEVNAGVSIVPNDLPRLGTLGAVADEIRARLS